MTEWAQAPSLRPLWQALHERLSSGQPVSSVRIGKDWNENERTAVADLLGLERVPAPGRSLALSRIEAAVAEIGGAELRVVVEQVVGPIGDRRSERSQAQDERRQLWAQLRSCPPVQAEPALLEWVSYLQASGLVGGSVPATQALVSQALSVLDALPVEGLPLPILADRVLHDPHALDEGHRLATVVLRGLAYRYGPELSSRGLWSRAGVDTDELSSTVLVAGLAARGGGSAPAVLRAAAAAGEAAVLTLQQVRNLGVAEWDTGIVHVVENPSVMAAALRRFGTRCPALVCGSGWPSAAGVLLLRRMAASGLPIRYHGDFDGDGLRIAAHLVAKVGAVPWRMTAADYDQAYARRPSGPDAGRVSDVPWDTELTARLRQTRTTVTEESVIDVLLEDLSAALGPGTG
ncbi:TIGR02679 family protein [Kineosporia rhizophila]|uniref:TIGR02679 family protein n=1 Tax=Kineosporia rhizophila TaxID=84633 RepID=UPI001E627D1A|nr:TIGR02679 family protein [Kineosporia rhizophila]MCE0540751.1 TIGR02679 family protein [Kineosporia rhizophila]